jgi:hypothetical protein
MPLILPSPTQFLKHTKPTATAVAAWIRRRKQAEAPPPPTRTRVKAEVREASRRIRWGGAAAGAGRRHATCGGGQHSHVRSPIHGPPAAKLRAGERQPRRRPCRRPDEARGPPPTPCTTHALKPPSTYAPPARKRNVLAGSDTATTHGGRLHPGLPALTSCLTGTTAPHGVDQDQQQRLKTAGAPCSTTTALPKPDRDSAWPFRPPWARNRPTNARNTIFTPHSPSPTPAT